MASILKKYTRADTLPHRKKYLTSGRWKGGAKGKPEYLAPLIPLLPAWVRDIPSGPGAYAATPLVSVFRRGFPSSPPGLRRYLNEWI